VAVRDRLATLARYQSGAATSDLFVALLNGAALPGRGDGEIAVSTERLHFFDADTGEANWK
jgi:hypothetical protein